MRSYSDAYLETDVLTASPERLHLLVVDAAVRFARKALLALENGENERAFETLGRSRACVAEMLAAVRPEGNPQLAERLKGLFVFAHRNLVRADLEHSPQLVREALVVLETHRQTWLDLMEILGRERGAAQGPHSVGGTGRDWQM